MAPIRVLRTAARQAGTAPRRADRRNICFSCRARNLCAGTPPSKWQLLARVHWPARGCAYRSEQPEWFEWGDLPHRSRQQSCAPRLSLSAARLDHRMQRLFVWPKPVRVRPRPYRRELLCLQRLQGCACSGSNHSSLPRGACSPVHAPVVTTSSASDYKWTCAAIACPDISVRWCKCRVRGCVRGCVRGGDETLLLSLHGPAATHDYACCPLEPHVAARVVARSTLLAPHASRRSAIVPRGTGVGSRPRRGCRTCISAPACLLCTLLTPWRTKAPPPAPPPLCGRQRQGRRGSGPARVGGAGRRGAESWRRPPSVVPAFPAAGSASVHAQRSPDPRRHATVTSAQLVLGGEWTPASQHASSRWTRCGDAVGAAAFGKAMRVWCRVCRSPHRAVLSGASAFLFHSVLSGLLGPDFRRVRPRVPSPWRRVRRRGEGLFRVFRFEKRLVQPVRLDETPQRCSARKMRLQNRRPAPSLRLYVSTVPPVLFCRR